MEYENSTLLFAGILNFMPLFSFKISSSRVSVFNDITPLPLGFLYVEVKVISISLYPLLTISKGYSSSGRSVVFLGLMLSPLLDFGIVQLFLFNIKSSL